MAIKQTVLIPSYIQALWYKPTLFIDGDRHNGPLILLQCDSSLRAGCSRTTLSNSDMSSRLNPTTGCQIREWRRGTL